MKRAGHIAMVLALLAAGACSSRSPVAPIVVALFDVSGSVDSTTRAGYLRDFVLVAEATASRHGALYGELIGANPTDDSAVPIAEDFTPSSRAAGNELYEKAERRKKVAHAIEQARSVVALPPQGGTDILTGVALAGRLFDRFGGSRPKFLVVFSDMAATRSVNLYSTDLSDRHVKELITQLHHAGRVAHLKGVEVYVSGAGLDPSGHLSAERNFAIQHFWTRYFAEAGASLDPGRYAARLVSFP